MKENLLNINNIRTYILDRKVYWTLHCLNRLHQRDISVFDVRNAINSGEIIEYYYNDYPYQSCLISGKDNKGNIIHVVCGVSEELLYMITAYNPSINKWEKDKKTRRK